MSVAFDDSVSRILREHLGPVVLDLLQDNDVVEILVRRHGVSVDRMSRGLERLAGAEVTVRIADVLRVLAPYANVQLSHQSPVVECDLPLDGERFSGLFAGPDGRDSFFTIRRVVVRDVPLGYYNAVIGGCNRGIAGILDELLSQPALGMLIAGGVGSGKTTFLRSCLKRVVEKHGENEHYVIVEDTPELRIEAPHVTPILATPWLPYHAALRVALRQRPTRIVVGEVRGGEALAAVKASSLGHGLLMSIHAETATKALITLRERMREGTINGYVEPALIPQGVHVVAVMRRSGSDYRLHELVRVHGARGEGFELESLLS